MQMARKYLNRKDNSEIDNLEPNNADERAIILKDKEAQFKQEVTKDTKEKINQAEQYMQYINSQLADRLLRIEKIKQSHENFERQIDLLQNEKNKQIKKGSIKNELLNEPESVKATRELSSLIQKYAVEKLDMMKKLFESEKKQSNERHQKLQENLSKITISEEKLKQQRDQLELEV